MQKYRCIKSFELSVYGEDERMADEYKEVTKGSVWEYEHDYRSNSDIRMYSENGNDDFGYIDITNKHLEEYFERIA